MFERFTERARGVVAAAETEAASLGHTYIGTGHLLLAMLQGPGVAHGVLTGAGITYDRIRAQVQSTLGLGAEDAAALQAIGIDLEAVRAKMEENFGAGAPGCPPHRLRFAPRSKKVLELSLREALARKHHYIGTEHILLALIREGEGLGAQAIVATGVRLADLRTATESAMKRAA
jgi:ATP-dependent Clp protease ATP-binding subunit ClpA